MKTTSTARVTFLNGKEELKTKVYPSIEDARTDVPNIEKEFNLPAGSVTTNYDALVITPNAK